LWLVTFVFWLLHVLSLRRFVFYEEEDPEIQS